LVKAYRKEHVVRFRQDDGPEVLKIKQIEVPPPAKAEVPICVHALYLNRTEVMVSSGMWVEQPGL
jgi:NADPH:quinone reductase-like Zn-dependent oxidoreductase